MAGTHGRATAALIAALAAGMAFATAAGAAVTITPTTFADNGPPTTDPVTASDCDPGSTAVCTLREAFVLANEPPRDGEIVLSGGRYELDPARGSLFVDETSFVVVRGAGARASIIDANGGPSHPNRVLIVGPVSRTELRDLGVTGGFQAGGEGGAILIQDGESGGPLFTLTRVWMFDNHNGDGGGGAIANRGTLRISNSLLSGNTAAGNGGAILNSDGLTLTNSTVSGNTAQRQSGTADGGGIYNQGNWPGQSADPFLHVEASTIAGNSAPNGNGGGVATLAPAAAFPTFHNSIVSDNTADGDDNCSGNVPASDPQHPSSEGHNLEDGGSCEFTATGDRNADAKLAALANNGGPTDTRATQDGSAAIDGGDPARCELFDQRGTVRPQGLLCDIGAFERAPAPPQVPQQQPAGDQQPPAGGQRQPAPDQPRTPPGQTCQDAQPPTSVLLDAGVAVRPTRVILAGGSRDPDACPSGVQRVEVSLAKVRGTDLNCRFVRRSNRFVITPFRNCRRPVLFRAAGTTSWSFTFRVRLPPGKYRVQARATDNARNKETPTKGRNIRYFRVR